MNKLVKIMVGSMLLLLVGCSSTPQDNKQALSNDPRDPLEQYNRPIFEFNWKVLDANILKPVAKGYQQLPQGMRDGLINAAQNLDEPVSLVNNLLQFKLKDASVTTGRFLINSTVGLLGLFDVAGEIGLKQKEEDFAQTLGVWGADQGAYLMVPVRGPSTTKDLSGDVVDAVAFGFNMLELPQSLIKLTIKTLDTRVELMDQEQLLNDAIDPYSFTKEAYLQRQEYKMHDGNVPVKDVEQEYEGLDDFDENEGFKKEDEEEQ